MCWSRWSDHAATYCVRTLGVTVATSIQPELSTSHRPFQMPMDSRKKATSIIVYFHLLVNFNHTNMKLINLCIVTTLMAVVAGQQQCQHALKAVGTLCTGNGNVCDIYQQSSCDSAMKDVLALKNYPACSATASQYEIVMHTCNGHVSTGDIAQCSSALRGTQTSCKVNSNDACAIFYQPSCQSAIKSIVALLPNNHCCEDTGTRCSKV